MLITQILMTLPLSYNYFRSAWDSAAPDQKTIENLTSLLIMEETWMSSQEKSENSAFMMRGQRDMQKYANRGDDFNREKKGMQYNRSHAENQRKQKVCWECGKFGHIRRNCWLLPGNEHPNSSSSEKRRSNSNNNMAPATARQRDAIVGEMLITPMKREDRSNSWILDFGASEHMCDKREWHVTYKTLNNHLICIGDGRILHAVAKGDINKY